MLARKFRLTKPKDLEKVFKQGELIRGKTLSLKILKNKLPHTRVGFIVPLKRVSGVVERNKIKRQLREITRSNFNKIQLGLDIIVIAQSNIEGKKHQEVLKELIGLFQRAKILK